MASRKLLYKDDKIIILNKPRRLAVHGDFINAGGTNKSYLDITEFGPNARLVHRLDKDTTGCLLIARSKQVARLLTDMIQREDKPIRSAYLTLLIPPLNDHLYPQGSRHFVTTGITKVSTNKYDTLKMVPWHPSFQLQRGNDIQRAATKFTFIKNAPLASLVCCEPITGRKHQLRLHATALNSQILGDEKFGPERKFKDWIKFNGVTPLHLHSTIMWINNWYGNGNHLSVFAPPPQFFSDSLGHAKLKMPKLTYVDGEVHIE